MDQPHSLALHAFHQSHGAHFVEINDREAVAHYGNAREEYQHMEDDAAVFDLSYRARLCVLGADRAKFLNGQVTNNIKDLRAGDGCHAAIVSAKGKIQSDVRVFVLENEILLETEPACGESTQQRLDKYVIAEDVQIVDVASLYGLWSVHGNHSASLVKKLNWPVELPPNEYSSVKISDSRLGDVYVVNHPRTIWPGFDLFVPLDAMQQVGEQLMAAGGKLAGWDALEMARIEAGIPRFGVDMDENNLAPEVLPPEAISYSKGCYIGQEVIARIRTYGQVAKALRGLTLPEGTKAIPKAGDKLFLDDKEVGFVTSATASPKLGRVIALGYVRKEANAIGRQLTLHHSLDKIPVEVVKLPLIHKE